MLRIVLLLLTVALSAHADTAEAVRFLERKVQEDPRNYLAWNQLTARYLTLLREGGKLEQLTHAEQAAAASLKAAPAEQNPGGLGARAAAEMAGHHFLEALATATLWQTLRPAEAAPWQLIGDARLALGDAAEAERAFQKMAEIDPDPLTLAPRLGRLALLRGHPAEALAHFEATRRAAADAPPELLAWSLVQLGEFAFRQGDWEHAEQHYQAALAALPGHVFAREHLAELRGAQGRTEEAVALYQPLIEQTDRPEFSQALGDLYAFTGAPEKAAPWHHRAEAGYLASVKAGHVLYYHHLAGFYAEAPAEPAQAVIWAQRDLELRHSIEAWDALAWAFYQNGQLPEAAETIPKALATGTADSHILYHAGLIRLSAGDLTGGKAALRQALTANPRHTAFHVHR